MKKEIVFKQVYVFFTHYQLENESLVVSIIMPTIPVEYKDRRLAEYQVVTREVAIACWYEMANAQTAEMYYFSDEKNCWMHSVFGDNNENLPREISKDEALELKLKYV